MVVDTSQHKTNAIAWNPREPFNFSIVRGCMHSVTHHNVCHDNKCCRLLSFYVAFQASEDSQCYTFDMRKLDMALMVHKDHVSAVYVWLVSHTY